MKMFVSGTIAVHVDTFVTLICLDADLEPSEFVAMTVTV